MAKCTACDNKIPIYQMSPYCKKCGAHLMFASFEAQFEKDRRISEMSMANFRYNKTKVVSSYTSNTAQKLRVASVILPVAALLLPLGGMNMNLPFYSSSLSFNVIDLFVGPFFLNGLFGRLGEFIGGPVFGDVALGLKSLIIAYAIMVASAVVILLSGLLSFIGNKKVCITSMLFSLTGVIGSVLVKITGGSLAGVCEGLGDYVTVNNNIFFIVAALFFIASGVAAFNALRNPPVYNFREGDELRVEYRKKYKKGKIALMDIPAPIYESEEDKLQKRKLINEAYNISEEEVSADV